MSRRFSIAALGACLGALACGADPADEEALELALTAASLVTAVPAPPQPVLTTDGRRHLVYELVVQNVGATAVQIGRLEVIDAAGRGRPLASYEGVALAAILVTTANDGTGTVGPGEGAIAFFDLALPPVGRVPERLAHRISATCGGRRVAVAGSPVAVVEGRPPRLGPPLHGGGLLDLNGCCTGDHTRALFAFEDGLFLAQRYAIDFVRVDVAAALAGGNPLFDGDPLRNESYFTFGAEIVAAAAGTVADTRDGIAENTPTVLPAFDLDTAAGNYVVEALDDGRFALYAHMQTGSVRVHAGDRVGRGQVLGLVGNTGHSDSPHLHFHVMDRPSPLHANGVPYVFDRFALQATVDLTADDPAVDPVPAPNERTGRLPMNGDILAFP